MKWKITKTLVLLSIIITSISFIYDDILVFWMSKIFFWYNSFYVIIQFFLYSFLHWDLLHLLFNMVFLYYFGQWVEYFLWWKKYLLFFIFSTIFNWICLLAFSSWNTIWISGFWLALMAFYTAHLYDIKNPEYKWWFTAIWLNIFIWLSSGISFVWHLSGAIWGYLFYQLHKKLWK